MKKILCSITAALMALTLVSCGDGETSSTASSEPQNMLGGGNIQPNANISEKDLPYGATLYELSESNDDYIKIVTDFDKRYFTDEDGNIKYNEIYKIYDYMIALDTNDHELFKSTCYPGFLEYFCEQNELTVDEYIDNLYNALRSEIGENSFINYIDISNCYTEATASFKSYYELRNSILKSIGVENIASRKTVEIGGYTTFKNDEGVFPLTKYSMPIIICVYEIDGQIYIL